MKILLILSFVFAPLAFAENWVELFDGKTLTGWVNQSDVNWSVVDGAITADTGQVSLLTTSKKFENYELELEFKAAIGANSGRRMVFLQVVS